MVVDDKGQATLVAEIPTLLADAPEKAVIIEDKNGDQFVVQKQSDGTTKVTKVEGGGLVVGPDGKILNKKELRKLDRMILASLRKYKKAIEDYQASIKNAPQKSKGGGPSLFEWEIEMFYTDLPQCLSEHKDKLNDISTRINTYLDSASAEAVAFRSRIAEAISKEFTTPEAQDNAPQERIDGEVCNALVEGSGTLDLNTITKLIDYDKLIKWLIDNKGKTVEYKFSDFISSEIYEKITGNGIVHRIPVDKLFYATIDGEQKAFALKGTLSTEKGNVNLDPNAGKIGAGIAILPAEDKIRYTLNYNFTDKNETAIGLETNNSDEMAYLFLEQNITYKDWYKQKVTANFKQEIANSGNDCNKLDYIYENIPGFVITSFSDDDKWKHLESLSACWVNAIGTNEYEAILNILKNLSASYLKTKADANAEFLMDIYDRLGSAEKTKFTITATQKIGELWTGNEELKVIFPDETLIIESTGLHVISCFGSDQGLTFAYSYFEKDANGFYKNPEDQLHDQCVLQFDKTGSEPVILRVGDDEFVVPAFIAAQTMINSKSESASSLLSIYTSVLLPNALIKPATLTKWSKFFNRSAAEANDVVSILKTRGYSLFEEIDNVLFIRDANGKVGKILDKNNLNNITWFTPQAGSTWQIHQVNASNYLRFKYGNNVTQQLKVRIYHKNGSTVDCYLDDVVETSDARFIISDAKHSQKAAIVDGQIPGYTTNQTQGYQWIVDGNATKIEVIGDKGLPNITRQTDLLPRLDGKIRILTNNTNGEIVESSILRTR
jgi:hypothetical protein